MTCEICVPFLSFFFLFLTDRKRKRHSHRSREKRESRDRRAVLRYSISPNVCNYIALCSYDYYPSLSVKTYFLIRKLLQGGISIFACAVNEIS